LAAGVFAELAVAQGLATNLAGCLLANAVNIRLSISSSASADPDVSGSGFMHDCKKMHCKQLRRKPLLPSHLRQKIADLHYAIYAV
jgi:hypothetical protein